MKRAKLLIGLEAPSGFETGMEVLHSGRHLLHETQ
jgi:hypothetical protein